MDEKKGINNALGTIRIADEVVSIIAGLAATEVEGVAGMSGGIAGGIAEILGRKNFSKGVKVEVGEKEAAIDLYIIVKYGVRIPDIALNVQEAVKAAIEKDEEMDFNLMAVTDNELKSIAESVKTLRTSMVD